MRRGEIGLDTQALTAELLKICIDWMKKNNTEHPDAQEEICFGAMVSAITVVVGVAQSNHLSKDGLKLMLDEIWSMFPEERLGLSMTP